MVYFLPFFLFLFFLFHLVVVYMLKLERSCVQGGGDLFFIFCVFARIYHE